MRAQVTILVTASTIALLAAGVSSAAVSEQALATKALPGQMIAGPRSDAVLRRAPVRVAVRVPSGTTRLTATLGKRDVSSRFRAAGGARRVAELTLGDGLRYGANHLYVLAQRGDRRPLAQAHSFALVRRDSGLVRARVRASHVTRLDVRLAGGPRLSAQRRSRTLRLWLNGKRITRALDTSRQTRLTASLSAAHGLRHGVNRLRLLLVEPDRGRYTVVRRRFVVPRNRHLAAAGWDVATRMGAPTRLDGSRSRAAGGGRLDHRWRILRKPRGSRAKLRRSRSARPTLSPDRRGRYVLGLTVTKRGGRSATASQTSAGDMVTVQVAPKSPLVRFKGLTIEDGSPGIQVGGTFYPNPSPGGTALQWLTLDRNTLEPTKDGNSWLDGGAGGDHGIDAFGTALRGQGVNQLTLLSYPYERSSRPPVQPALNDEFNRAMATIGVGPISARILQDTNKLAILGVPVPTGGNAGSGWYTHGGAPGDTLSGWLMPDPSERFRFQPERPEFDTSSSQTATTNSMTLNGQRVDGALSDDRAVGGFQVVRLNPIDLTVSESRVFTTNGLYGQPLTGRRAMLAYLQEEAGREYHLAIQSIGKVQPDEPSATNSEPEFLAAWRQLADALSPFGVNPDTFNKVSGKYAFLGGSWLERSEVAESSSQILLDPTADPRLFESGTLSGRLRMRADGYLAPASVDEADALDFELYDVVLGATTAPWPYTREAGHPEADAYADALAYLTNNLDGLETWAPDLRRAYVDSPKKSWSDVKTNLLRLEYPSPKLTCPPRPGGSKPPCFTRQQFDLLSAQLQTEFDYLDRTKQMFDDYVEAWRGSGPTQQVNLHTIGDTIRKSVSPANDPDLVSPYANFVFMLMEALALFADIEDLAVVELGAAAYELTISLTTEDTGGVPAGERIDTKVSELAKDTADKVDDATGALESLRVVINSDWGRLNALGSVAGKKGWVVRPAQVQAHMTDAANAYFSQELMPVGYKLWYLAPTFSLNDVTPDRCKVSAGARSFAGAPSSSWMDFQQGKFPGQSDRGGSVLALGKYDWGVRESANPPTAFTNKMFGAANQGGYGVYLPDFFWSRYRAPYPTVSCYG